MQTIKDFTFKALYTSRDLTKYAIILAVYLLSHCDQNGRITIHHADMEQIMGVDSKVFYANLHRLESTIVTYNLSKDKTIESPLIVREESSCKGDICLRFPYNDFDIVYDGEDKPFSDFVKIDYTWLKCDILKSLSHAEIRVLLYLFFRAYKSGDLSSSVDFNTKSSAYRSIAKQLSISTQTVRKAIYKIKANEYIKVDSSASCENNQTESLAMPKSKVHFSLCELFRQEIVNLVTTSRKDVFGERQKGQTTEKHFRADRHTVRNILRKRNKRGKYIAPEQEINDIAALINQYRNTAKEIGKKIEKIVDAAIADCALVRAKIVHAFIRQALNI
jgi:DNA-binding Lrp family transcriptional regulator